MAPRDPQAVLQKLGAKSLKVDGFFLRRTGFIANQTVLKLGEYHLNCVPASLGLEESRFLAVLSANEVNFFGQFKAGIHILILTFDNPDLRDVLRFPLRVTLTDITPVPDRKNVCFLDLRFRSLPAEYILFLGDYQEELEARQESWEKLADRELALNPELAAAVGAGFGIVLGSGDTRFSVELVSFHTKLLRLRIPDGSPSLAGAENLQLRLAFRERVLSLDGTLDAEGCFFPEFSSEWLTFVEEYRFQTSLKPRGPGRKDP